MGMVYRNAHFTIAAVDTEDTTSGCFTEREGLRDRPGKLELDVKSYMYLQGGEIHACVLQNRQSDIYLRRGPLDKRAWVLQEQLLSPRILNFGKDGVYWECLTKRTLGADIRRHSDGV
jgi:hypothetical protein